MTIWEIHTLLHAGQSSCHFHRETCSILHFNTSTSTENACLHRHTVMNDGWTSKCKFINMGIIFHLVAPKCMKILLCWSFVMSTMCWLFISTVMVSKQMAALSMLDTTISQKSSSQNIFPILQKLLSDKGHQRCWPNKSRWEENLNPQSVSNPSRCDFVET